MTDYTITTETVLPTGATLIAPPQAETEDDVKLKQLLADLWQADAAVTQWTDYRADLRKQIADHIAAQNNGNYSGKTVHIDDNWKFVLTTQKTFKMAKSHPRFKELSTRLPNEKFNLIFRTKQKAVLEVDRDKWMSVLTPEEQSYFKECCFDDVNFSFKFEQKTDDR